ncbi:hypothetical protein GpartN1_g1571.t1 [Galdieria partita]|uniref:Queuosine 5'-phosphate N-glycosylase/hydrolase n=1 Tax=Galdieria partita TaxID=83374 RepID=A0A9C7PSN1_9RHOD|nr:hypothetical protein GpartN1_g1571.t1 [Galdieria partita]
MSLLERVRESAEFVRSRAKHVSMDMEAIQSVGLRLKRILETRELSVHKIWNDCPLNPVWGENRAGICCLEDICRWIFWIDCINFCFWQREEEEKWTIWYKNKRYTGYFALCAALNLYLETRGNYVLSAEFLKQLTASQLKEILMPESQSQGVIPLLFERVHCLREAGCVLDEYFQGSVYYLIRSSHGSLETVVDKVVQYFPSFRDEAIYEGQRVFFYKRAQIFAADIFACLGQEALSFRDPCCLTMFADYRVPQVLHKWGVLNYSDILLAQLQQGMEIKETEEVEIRACSIAAVEMILKEIQKTSPNIFVSSQLIDYLLWSEAMNMKSLTELDKTPFHRVRTIFY